MLSLLIELRHSLDPEAGGALRRLAGLQDLSSWNSVIERIRAEREVRGTGLAYSFPTPHQVQSTLQNGGPSSAADLIALLADQLAKIGQRLRTLDTNGWRKYWNEDRNQAPKRPKREESCRDVLLEELRLLLPNGVEAEPEAVYVAGKRADIRVRYGNLQVPIEIKKHVRTKASDHLGYIRNQLIGRYASRSATEATTGYGVYLILWFGATRDQKSPGALEREVAELLSGDERQRIHVHALDVRPPGLEAEGAMQPCGEDLPSQ